MSQNKTTAVRINTVVDNYIQHPQAPLQPLTHLCTLMMCVCVCVCQKVCKCDAMVLFKSPIIKPIALAT